MRTLHCLKSFACFSRREDRRGPAPFLAGALLLLPSLCAATGCQQRVADSLEPDQVTWATYRSVALGFEIDHPAVWVPHEQPDAVLFQDPAVTPLRVLWLEPAEARRRGLWGRSIPERWETPRSPRGRLYRYDHFDGPFYVPTLAYVVAHRERELGVELRTRLPGPDDLFSRIVESLVRF